MRYSIMARLSGVAAVGALVLAGCASATQEPPNLYPLKQTITANVESGRYEREIGVVAARAKAWIEERSRRPGAKLAVVFDLDETLFFNWPHIREMDFGYVRREWDRWVEEARAPAIESVRDVYRVARQRGVEVIFITGRPEKARNGTERNLRAIDCGEYAELHCKPNDDSRRAAEFKAAVRRQITANGRTIIANIGDQESDLSGGYSERNFKLPNAFYLTE